MPENLKRVSLSIPFSTSAHAYLASQVINIDDELKNVRRSISVEDTNLIVNLEGEHYKYLRLSLNGLLQNLCLVTRTISLFN